MQKQKYKIYKPYIKSNTASLLYKFNNWNTGLSNNLN